CDPRELAFQVKARCGSRIFVNKQRCRRVSAEDRQHIFYVSLAEEFSDFGGEILQVWMRRPNPRERCSTDEAWLRLTSVSERHRSSTDSQSAAKQKRPPCGGR